MNPQKIKTQKHQRRKARVRAKIFGTSKIPRLSIFRSLKNISVQLIDDENNKTLASANDKNIKGSKTDRATEVGKLIANKAIEKNIKTCVFDKSGYKYHGRVKAIAESARKKGLKF